MPVPLTHPLIPLAATIITGPVPNTQGWLQVAELVTALVLSAAIGLEREIRQKSAGMRTHTLVGVGAALFMLVSKYGFSDVAIKGLVVADPSRVAAQIVSGVGFLGAGLIFIRRDSVRGLTTAASIWVTAAVGTAAGAGLPLIALATTIIYFVTALGFHQITRRLPRSATAISTIAVRYPDGRGTLREILAFVTNQGFAVDELSTSTDGYGQAGRFRPGANGHRGGDGGDGRMVTVNLQVHGRGVVNDLAAELSELPGVQAVIADDVNAAQPS